MIDFNFRNTSLKSKLRMINMIDELNVNNRVGRIILKLINESPINTEILTIMTGRYSNVYYICIDDCLN